MDQTGVLVACHHCGGIPPELLWEPDPYAAEFPESHTAQELAPRWWCHRCLQERADAI